jgi:murein DD-endopeptidase MepM/ murein hydrolase activator NlpD
MVGLLIGSAFGIFFSGEDSGTGRTMPAVISELSAEFYGKVEEIKADNPHDELDIGAMAINWPEVLAVYAIHTGGATDVVTLDDARVDKLRTVLNDMVSLNHTLQTETRENIVINEDGIETTEEEAITTLVISLTQKNPDEMADLYGFSEQQKQQLSELLSPAYAGLWAHLMGGYITGSGEVLVGDLSYIPNDIFSWPFAENHPITSIFGYRNDPFTGETVYHSGTDIGAPGGTPIIAAAGGTVTIANSSDSWGGGFGYYVRIQHDGGYETLYVHASQVAVVSGQEVEKGEVIAYVGSTGRSTGNHLHFEVLKDGARTDPLGFFD